MMQKKPPESKPLVSIVVLNRNGEKQIRRCFPSVLAQDYPNYEIVFVDNASEDGSLAVATEMLECVSIPYSIVALKENLGYSGGKNAGAKACRGRFLWLLDNDIAPEKICLSRMVDLMSRHPEVALLGPILLDIDDQRVVGGGYFLGYLRQPRRFTAYQNDPHPIHLTSYVSGAVMLVREEVWDALGGFDESGMFFLDDNDFGPRCWIAGHQVAVACRCFAYHFDNSRRSHDYWRWRFRQFSRSTLRGMIRNYSPTALAVAMPSFVAFAALKAFKNAVSRMDYRILHDGLLSLYNGITDMPESFRQRRVVQSLRRIPGDRFLKLK